MSRDLEAQLQTCTSCGKMFVFSGKTLICPNCGLMHETSREPKPEEKPHALVRVLYFLLELFGG